MKKQILNFLGLAGIGIGSLVLLFSCNDDEIMVPPSPYPISEDRFSLETIAEGFNIPYGIAIVEEDEYFITDRVGKLFHFRNGDLTEISGMPAVINFGDPIVPEILHGGLMDVSLHPDYENNAWIYISYLAADGFAKVSRFRIRDNAASGFEDIFTTRGENYYGNGMRIVWEDESHFFLNVGGTTLSTSKKPDLIAQDLEQDAGKIHRLREDGSIPADNPVFEGYTAPMSIWSYGHRDAQGLYYDPAGDSLFGVEHGPKGGDEFNVILKGKNYGWPLFTYGINYDGAGVSTISKDSSASFSVLPEHYWTVQTSDGGRAIGPADLLKVENSNISDWNNHFLFGSLAYRRLMKYNRDTDETFGMNIEGRVRTIRQLPGGDIILLIERSDRKQTNGKLVRVRNSSTVAKPN